MRGRSSQSGRVPVDSGTWPGREKSSLQAEGRRAAAAAAVVVPATETQVGLRTGWGWRWGRLIGGDGDLRERSTVENLG